MAGILAARFGANSNIRAAGGGGSGLPITETWTGTTGAAWPSQWTVTNTSGTGGAATIQANAGRLVTPTTAYGTIRAMLAGMPVTTDMNAVVTVTFAAQTQTWFSITVRDSNVTHATDQSYPATGYTAYVTCNGTPTSGVLTMWKTVNSTNTGIGGAQVTKTITAGTPIKVRIQVLGTTVRCRLWTASAAEPSTWDYTSTDSSIVSGRAGIYYQNQSTAGTAATVTVDDYSLTAT